MHLLTSEGRAWASSHPTLWVRNVGDTTAPSQDKCSILDELLELLLESLLCPLVSTPST